MALTSLDTESDSKSSSNSKEEDKVFIKLSHSDLITFTQDLMGWCQEKSRHTKILKKKYHILKDELKSSQNKN